MRQLTTTLLAGLLATTILPASAMYLNPRGSGEVLLFPYYTVNAGQATLISLTNTTDKPKFVSAVLREGYAGRAVLDFNIILAPHDSWTGTLYSTDDTGRAVLLTRDASCTVPDKSNGWTAAPGNAWQVGLFNFSYTGNNVDGGPTDLARTREGYLVITERAELSGALAAAAGQGSTRNCSLLQGFSPTGNADLRPPGGGLYGNFSIVNVGQGTLLGGAATAIADFTDRPLFTDGAPLEMLAQGGVTTDSQGSHVSAQVFTGGRLTEVAYPAIAADARPVDATSALLMAEALYGDFSHEASVGSQTEWVITAPTKFMYTDNKILQVAPGTGTARPPFRDVFNNEHEAGSCMPFTVSAADREGRPITFDGPFALDPPPPLPRYPSHNLCHATGVVYFGDSVGSGATPVLGSRLGVPVWHPSPHTAETGSVKLELGVRRGFVSWDGGGAESGPSFLTPGTRGPGLRGLPVIGFQAVRYVNANVLPGVLANYTQALPLQSSVRCTDAAGADAACP